MKLGLSSFAFNWAIGVAGFPPPSPLTPLDLLERVAALGVRVVQFGDNLPLGALSFAELDALAARAAELSLEIEIGTRGIGEQHLCDHLALAQRLQARVLRTVADTAQHHPSEDEIVSRVRAVVRELERSGVCLAIENHDRFKVGTLARIMKRIASDRVGICLDTTNSLGAAEGPERVLEALGPWTVNLHVKDFTVRRMSHMMGFVVEGCPAGQGQLDIPGLLAGLGSFGRNPNAILELWTAPGRTLDESIARESVWVGESVYYMRGLLSD